MRGRSRNLRAIRVVFGLDSTPEALSLLKLILGCACSYPQVPSKARATHRFDPDKLLHSHRFHTGVVKLAQVHRSSVGYKQEILPKDGLESAPPSPHHATMQRTTLLAVAVATCLLQMACATVRSRDDSHRRSLRSISLRRRQLCGALAALLACSHHAMSAFARQVLPAAFDRRGAVVCISDQFLSACILSRL